MAEKKRQRPTERREYAVYYPDIGRYSIPMKLKEAIKLAREFPGAEAVALRTAEIFA